MFTYDEYISQEDIKQVIKEVQQVQTKNKHLGNENLRLKDQLKQQEKQIDKWKQRYIGLVIENNAHVDDLDMDNVARELETVQ